VEDDNADELEDMIKTKKSLWGLSSERPDRGGEGRRQNDTASPWKSALLDTS